MDTRESPILALLALCLALGLLPAGYMAARYGISWPSRLIRPHPPGIVIHHSASPGEEQGEQVDAALIDRWHARRGFGLQTARGQVHIGYHYVILADGTVEQGRPEWMKGAHARGHNDRIGICLVGNFSSSGNPGRRMKPDKPTKAQLDALHDLLCKLCRKYHLRPQDVVRHRDLAKTACPGDRFPYDAVIRRLGQSLGTMDEVRRARAAR